MNENLMELLVEPVTGSLLKLKVDSWDTNLKRIITGSLKSEATGIVYPIRNGIPRFVSMHDDYASNFGLQWNKFRTVQIDSCSGYNFSRKRFESETAWNLSNIENIADKWILDVGCGAGRFAEIAAESGANLVALDMSSAVDSCAETLRKFSNANIVQGDVFRLPFREKKFDYIYSIGVVQHTPDPRKAIRMMYRNLKHNGDMVLTLYGDGLFTKLNMKYLIRPLTKTMDKQELLRKIEKLVPMVFPFCDSMFRIPFLGRLMQFMIPVAVYVDRAHRDCEVDHRIQEAVLDTFDMLAPTYDLPMTYREIKNSLEELQDCLFEIRSFRPINCVVRRQ